MTFTLTLKDEYAEFVDDGLWLLDGYTVDSVWLLNAETEELIRTPKHWWELS